VNHQSLFGAAATRRVRAALKFYRIAL